MSTFNEIIVKRRPTEFGSHWIAYREGTDPEEDPCGIGPTAEDAKQDLIDAEREKYVL